MSQDNDKRQSGAVFSSLDTPEASFDTEMANNNMVGSPTATPSNRKKKSRRKQKQPRHLATRSSPAAAQNNSNPPTNNNNNAEAREDNNNNNDNQGKSPPTSSTRFHPESKWEEPYFAPEQDDRRGGANTTEPPERSLTLYEIHRRPRLLHPTNPSPRQEASSSSDISADAVASTAASGSGTTMEPQTRRKKRARPAASTATTTSITCDYQNLVDEFRCAICFGTLRRTKIVRECLHRFCETCMETCLRRFTSSFCPVCRVVVPTRRSLTVDHVYDTIIEAIGLGDSEDENPEEHKQRVDEAVAISASLHDQQKERQQQQQQAAAAAGGHARADRSRSGTSPLLPNQPSPLQAAIAKNREMRLQKRRQEEEEQEQQRLQQLQQEEDDGKRSPKGSSPPTSAAAAATPQAETPGTLPPPLPVAPLVEVHLKPHPVDLPTLPALELPYLRIAGDATVSVLECFVRQKLRLATDMAEEPSPTAAVDDAAASSSLLPYYFSATLWRKPLARTTQLRQLLPGAANEAAAAAAGAATPPNSAPKAGGLPPTSKPPANNPVRPNQPGVVNRMVVLYYRWTRYVRKGD